MKLYPKAFERYWGNATLDSWTGIQPWQWGKIKRIAYLSWQAGRKQAQEHREKEIQFWKENRA